MKATPPRERRVMPSLSSRVGHSDRSVEFQYLTSTTSMKFFLDTRRLKDNFAFKSTFKLNIVCMYVMSTYMKFVCPYCLQTSHKVSQSIGLFGAQAPLGRFLHSGDSPVCRWAFNWTKLRNRRGFWIEVMRDSFCFVTCCTATAYGCSANGSPTLKKSLLRSSFLLLCFLAYFFWETFIWESPTSVKLQLL